MRLAEAGVSPGTSINRVNPGNFCPENRAATNLMMWREQGKDQMSQ
jgi:hypothetical protein